MNILFVFATIFMPLERVIYTTGRVVVQCDCKSEAKSNIAQAISCLHGPPYLCGPSIDPVKSIAPYRYWWMNLPPSDRPYVCIYDSWRCWFYDRDFDGDVDLADWAIFTVELSRPQRKPERGHCGEDPNTRSTCSPGPTPWGDLRP